MEIKRDKYLNDLLNRMHNGMIKVVTGIRRCGKSYLLSHNHHFKWARGLNKISFSPLLYI